MSCRAFNSPLIVYLSYEPIETHIVRQYKLLTHLILPLSPKGTWASTDANLNAIGAIAVLCTFAG